MGEQVALRRGGDDGLSSGQALDVGKRYRGVVDGALCGRNSTMGVGSSRKNASTLSADGGLNGGTERDCRDYWSLDGASRWSGSTMSVDNSSKRSRGVDDALGVRSSSDRGCGALSLGIARRNDEGC
jgi:hypothetical protein